MQKVKAIVVDPLCERNVNNVQNISLACERVCFRNWQNYFFHDNFFWFLYMEAHIFRINSRFSQLENVFDKLSSTGKRLHCTESITLMTEEEKLMIVHLLFSSHLFDASKKRHLNGRCHLQKKVRCRSTETKVLLRAIIIHVNEVFIK